LVLWLVLGGILFMTISAMPRSPDRSEDLHQVFHVISDETLIVERTWAMVERGNMDYGIAVYPGLSPYVVAIMKLCMAVPAPFVLLAFLAHPESVLLPLALIPTPFSCSSIMRLSPVSNLALANDRRFLWAATMFAGLSADPGGGNMSDIRRRSPVPWAHQGRWRRHRAHKGLRASRESRPG
jgi:hypothetical protein